MEILDRNQLRFAIQADMMMNRGVFKKALVDRFKELLFPDLIMTYLYYMRKCSYYRHGGGILSKFMYACYLRKYRKMGVKLGFSIGCDSLGYGCVLPHYGTIIVGPSNRIGNYAVLHTSTCITDNGKIIGDGMYLATGAKITSKIKIGDNTTIGANSLVNKTFEAGNALIGGTPAVHIKEMTAWYERDGDKYSNRVKEIEKLKQELNIN